MAEVAAANVVAGYTRYSVEQSGTELVIVTRAEFAPFRVLARTHIQLPYELEKGRGLVYWGARQYVTRRPALVARLTKKK